MFLKPTYEQVQLIMMRLGLRFFTDVNDMNLLAVRSNVLVADKIDDTFLLVFKDVNGNGRVFSMPGSTDPGLYYIEHPMNARGCAMLCEGQYLGSHKLGLHKGHTALVQVKPMTFWRGVRVEQVGDMKLIKTDKAVVERGITGADVHRMLPDGLAATVGKWSAMCQVIQYPEDANYLFSMVTRQQKTIGSSAVSLTVLNEVEFTK